MTRTIQQKRAVYCIDHGHSHVVTVDWGRAYCARCETLLGDGLTQAVDNSDWVFCEPRFSCFGCDTCRENYHRLTKRDLEMLPEEHVKNLVEAFGEVKP